MLKKLDKRTFMKKSQVKTNINFKIKNELVYHIKNDVKRFCISFSCERIVFEQIHDLNNHVGYHKSLSSIDEFNIHVETISENSSIYQILSLL